MRSFSFFTFKLEECAETGRGCCRKEDGDWYCCITGGSIGTATGRVSLINGNSLQMSELQIGNQLEIGSGNRHFYLSFI